MCDDFHLVDPLLLFTAKSLFSTAIISELLLCRYLTFVMQVNISVICASHW